MATFHQYFPELEFEFNSYWETNGLYSVEFVPVPSILENSSLFSVNNFFKLLFNDNYSESDYLYYFDLKGRIDLSRPVRARIRATSLSILPYITDSSSTEDVFSILGSDTETMLDLLLTYRLNGTANLNSVTYLDLSAGMPQLIYQYLDLKINQSVSLINTENVYSDSSNVLDNLYELYVINEAYKFLSTNEDYYLQYPEIDNNNNT